MTRGLPLLLCAACVVQEVKVADGLGSFRVSASAAAWTARPLGCEDAPHEGTKACPRPFPTLNDPVAVTLTVQTLDRRGEPFAYNGAAQVDVRPGRFHNVGPGGVLMEFVNGKSVDNSLQIVHAQGETRFWVEDCGSSAVPGTFATGISQPVYFDNPRIDQVNEVDDDNTTSPLGPRATNVCAITGDPRYGLGVDEDGVVGFVGYSHGRLYNAPPPAIGNFVEVVGCGRDEYDATGGNCERGPIVVTGVDQAGFYVTDINPVAMATGFNHIYSFNFSYPEDLEVGDIVVSLRGAPVEFTGSTQFGNPLWIRDGVRRGIDLVPDPVFLSADLYNNTVRTYGRNDSTNMDLERYEGAVVCMHNLAPATTLVSCDKNVSGRIERQGCLVDFDLPLPPRCEVGRGTAPFPPACDGPSEDSYCFPMTEAELSGCNLRGYLPENPAEYCCERVCYNDFRCTEESSFIGFGQWVADVYGRYERTDSDPVKIALITRDANPDFDPIAFGNEQAGIADPAARETVMVTGTLRQVLAARPTWVVVARTPADIVPGGTCPGQ